MVTVAVGAATVALGSGCQSFAKLEDRTEDPPPAGLCALPSEGDAKVRIANLVPSTDNVDFCIKPAGTASYSHPILRNAGTEDTCANGLAYKQMTVPFATKSGAIDVKVVAAGAGGCSQPALAESTNVSVIAGAVTQLLYVGGRKNPAAVLPMREATSGTTFKVRFVNAISGIGPLHFGLTTGDRVPTTLSVDLVLNQPVDFGQTEPPSVKSTTGNSLDELSYVSIQATGATFGAAKMGDKNAVFAIGTGNTRGGKFSLFAVGDPEDIKFPPRALLCDEAATVGATGTIMLGCEESLLPSLSFEVYGTALYGLYAKYAEERLKVLPAKIAASNNDFLCLNDVWRAEDKKLFVDAAKDTYPYSWSFETTRDTPVDDPSMEDGSPANIPPPRAACGDDAALGNTLINCLQTKCNKSPTGDESGLLSSTECVSQQCLGAVIPLATGATPEKQGCFGCIVFDAAAYQPYSYIKTDCFDPNGGQGYFKGQNGNLILSKFPLSKEGGYVLPASGQKRVIATATATYEAGKTIDIHCGAMDAILDAPFNYWGPYSTSHDRQGYMDEQRLQTKRAITYIKKRSAETPALIGLGVFASEAVGNPRFVDNNPDVPRLLREAFTSAQAADYNPLCTVCGDENPIDDPSAYAWYHRIYINDKINPDAVVKSERRYTDAIVQVKDAVVPMSENFSYRIEVLRP